MAQMTHFMPSGFSVLEILSFSGNTIPHAWYTQITTQSGRPDHNAISIFSEIVYWYRPNREGAPKFKDDIWQTSYEHFETRFGYNNQRTRRALIRLEELGLIRREFRTIKKYGQTCTNVLFIRLISLPQNNSIFVNPHSQNENYNNICPEINSGQLVMSDSLGSSSSFDTGSISPNEEKSFSPEDASNTTIEASKKMYLPLYRFDTPSLQICREHIDKENIRENKERRSDQRVSAISISSISLLDEESVCLNEVSNSASEKNKETLKTEYQPDKSGIFSEISDKAKKLFGTFASKNIKPKPLDWEEGRGLYELSDISKEDMNELNKRSGRDFSLNFINQLILKLGIKCPEHRFFRRKQFMNYMVKALKNEILQAPQANNEDFKFACLPKTEEEKHLKQVHKYLDEIESSTKNSLDMRLSKKILGRLEPKLVYEILSGTSLSVNKTGEVDDDIELMELEIKILRPLKLNGFTQESTTKIPTWIQNILLEEARGVYGESVSNVRISSDIESKSINRKSQYFQDKTLIIESTFLSESTNPIWNKVRDGLRNTYGDSIDRSWFSKIQMLNSELDYKESNGKDVIDKKTTIKIAAPTSFMRDWVKTNYMPAIERELKQVYPNLNYIELVCNTDIGF